MLKNITLSAEESAIREARERAARQHRSLNAAFREWLWEYAQVQQTSRAYLELMERLNYADTGGSFSRDQMNER